MRQFSQMNPVLRLRVRKFGYGKTTFLSPSFLPFLRNILSRCDLVLAHLEY